MISEKQVWDTLKNVFDPEIPVNVVDLGLIYSVAVKDSTVSVDMTLTARGCPMHSYISQDTRAKLMAIPGIEDAQVRVVWDPPWNPTMISDAGRKALGWS